MKRYRFLIYTFIVLLLSNIPPLNSIFKFVSGDSLVPGMSESLYITKDFKYIYQGDLKDTLKNSCYRQYKEVSSLSNHTLYRFQAISPWKFWKWGDYLTEEKWQQPYINVSEEELKQALLFFSKSYNSPNGTISCTDFTSYKENSPE